jgi:Ca2+-transporting ATPase
MLQLIAATESVTEVIGNKTEGALIYMIKEWGEDYEKIEADNFNDERDKKFSFNSTKKRSTTIVTRRDGSVRVLCKGAPEYILDDCTTFYSNRENKALPLTSAKRIEINEAILD